MLLNTQGKTESLAEHATVYHECAKFADRQYHAILNSPDALRWKLYVERKRQEMSRRAEELQKTPSTSSKYRQLQHDQGKAKQLMDQDSESFRKHNVARDEFLKEAINMYSRCLKASDAFDDEGPIRFCSLWFANFDEVALQAKVGLALDRIPSRKLVFLAVSFNTPALWSASHSPLSTNS